MDQSTRLHSQARRRSWCCPFTVPPSSPESIMMISVKVVKLTKSPATLNQRNLGVVDEERDGSPEIVGLKTEISVENGYILAVFDVASLQTFFECPGLVPYPVLSDLIRYVSAFACPSLAFHFHHLWESQIENQTKDPSQPTQNIVVNQAVYIYI
ncbi:hypothetical protein CIPAW_15G156900 [Carya illinoinensis]|uniref:Uncharacterized protein n=1 Tax=Carya illinoinensis TaxID=32201 RepID=A0A8T1N7Y7_CARIL|nr:hypothetical protein CIPAW_15G156900 [Carya illinoinensis]